MNRRIKKLIPVFIILVSLITVVIGFRNTHVLKNKNYSLHAPHNSGIDGTTVYVNDLSADYNYYKGLNYTYSQNNTYPTSSNKNIYNDTNLVKMAITYSGADIKNSSLVGTVSITETQNTYIYYKYFPVNNNNTPSNKSDDYVYLELIDNPFTNRPTNKGFNGWNTSYTGAKVIFDNDIYVRYAKIPVTYNGSNPNEINITFNASWIDANVQTLSSNNVSILGNPLNTAVNNLNTAGMKPLYTTHQWLAQDYKTRGDTIVLGGSYPSGAIDGSGNPLSGNCRKTLIQGGCPYYLKAPRDSAYNSGTTYYNLNNTSTVTPTRYETYTYTAIHEGDSLGSLFRDTQISANGNCSGLYNSSGTLQTSTSCSAGTYYELIQGGDSSGNITVATSNLEHEKYSYLVTRDTNILVIATNWTNAVGTALNKPMTVTSAYNGTDHGNYIQMSDTYIEAQADLTIENIRLQTTTSRTTGADSMSLFSLFGELSNVIYGNFHNLKIGRGITRNTSNANYVSTKYVLGGSSGATGSSSNPTRYRLMVESGYYSSISESNASALTASTIYIEGSAIYGNDYDRVKGDNSKLIVFNCLSGTFGSETYSKDANTIALDATFKSGEFGSLRNDTTHGIYVGGRSSGSLHAPARAIIEGGKIFNINGGPLDGDTADTNLIQVYVKGGEIDTIFGGAATTATYGNRIIQMTGGTLTHSIFGGSNAYDGSGNDGTLQGSTYIYVGGNANLTGTTTTKYNAEGGSVFGVGAGTSSSNTIGTASNSTVIIDGEAQISNNIYGGGNFAAVGINSTSGTTTTMKVLGGTISGSIFGGGNNNGSGSNTVSSTVNITMTGGTVEGSVYGGSNVKGTIYGSTNVSVLGGTVENSVYGGGLGGYASNNSPGTFVGQNVNVVIGDSSIEPPPAIGKDVYGGSSFGTVNSTQNNTTKTNYTTHVTVNKGNITGSVYGGGQGNTQYTPKDDGDILVTINDGTIGSVFGGNNQSGVPSGDVVVVVNNGTIGDVYGGGNQTTVDETDVTINDGVIINLYGGCNNSGSTTTNTVINGGSIENAFGGANSSGDVQTSNITVTTGNPTIGNLYGGNNAGGKVGTCNVTTNSGTIGNVYGGGNNAESDTTTVIINNTDITTNIFAGGNNAQVSGDVVATVTSSTIGGNFFGGGNAGAVSGTATSSITGTEVTGDVYGGGNQAGVTGEVTLDIASSNISGDVFGGGNEGALGDSTTITIDDTEISGDVYGGGNQAAVASSATITLTDTTINSNLYGGGNAGTVGDSVSIDLDNTKVNGNIFGGGNGSTATINGSTTTTIKNNSSIGNSLYGGGNAAPISGDSTVYLSNSSVGGSAYAGGNGSSAVVPGNTLITIDGTSTVKNNVFGGGNAAFTGTEEDDNSSSVVNIAGGKIGGNVYGGANTSKIYGTAEVNIGYNAVGDTSLTKGDVEIKGTVFGGGEANASGSETYDFDFISVTKGIEINIDGESHNNFDLYGSIFGSGNASSAAGTSNIYIKNYGTRSDVKKNVSIQRADLVELDNTKIELSGATDRTNEYSSVKFSISRVKDLKLKNNSEIYVQAGTNLLEHFESLTSDNQLATVTIRNDGASISRNVDNRVYALEGVNVNISHVQQVTNNGDKAGDVDGMSFFGMYTHDRSGNIQRGIYDTDNFSYGDSVTYDEYYFFPTGSYVSGKHKLNHDIEVDGFYTNFAAGDDDTNTTIAIRYINPTPVDQPFYNWIVGTAAEEYEVDLVASKYLTLGSTEVPFSSHNAANSIFTVIGVNYEELNEEVELIDENDIPRIADTEDDANNVMGLSLKSGSSGWVTKGQTDFYNDRDDEIEGTTEYIRDNTNTIPSFGLYLYHSKNITEAGDLGYITITFVVTTPTDGLSSTIRRVKLKINLSRVLYTSNEYEGSITPGKKYDLFPSTTTNISTKSSFSTYFSLFISKDITPYKEGDYRTIISSYNLPVKTKLTLIDFRDVDKPEYYYLIIDNALYNAKQTEYSNSGEVTYDFSLFGTMGVENSSSYYDDEAKNAEYYDTTIHLANEEFIIIADFSESGLTTDVEDNSFLLELRNSEDRAAISVLGALQEQMVYSLYNVSDTIELEGSISKNNIYPGTQVDLDLTTTVSTSVVGNKSVFNSEFDENKMGVKITLLDSSNHEVVGTSLLGLSFEYGGKTYYPRMDGTTRINISPRVANVSANIKMNVPDTMADGEYTMQIDSFASPDGIYSGLYYLDRIQIPITILNTTYGLKVDIEDEMVIINKDTGLNLKDNNVLRLDFSCESYLSRANITLELSRRKYDSTYSLEYESVDLADYVTNRLTATSTPNEYLLFNVPITQINISYNLKENLTSGTYRLTFKIYDETEFIGEVYKYIVIK